MIKTYKGNKLTPNQYAKQMIIDAILVIDGGYWREKFDNEPMGNEIYPTEREMNETGRCITKQVNRIVKLLDPDGKILGQ